MITLNGLLSFAAPFFLLQAWFTDTDEHYAHFQQLKCPLPPHSEETYKEWVALSPNMQHECWEHIM